MLTENYYDSGYIYNTGVKARDIQVLAFMRQFKYSSDKLGRGLGGPSRVQGVFSQYTTKQNGGGNSDIINTNPIPKNGCYRFVRTDHILHFSQTSPRSRYKRYIYRLINRHRIRKRLKKIQHLLRKVSYTFNLI